VKGPPVEPRMESAMDDDITGMYELLDAIEAVIKAANPAKREALARTMPGPTTSPRRDQSLKRHDLTGGAHVCSGDRLSFERRLDSPLY
jgi:hypothetical protein